MALSAGTRLGPYEILEPLGAGGMGEVYRARDTRLDRDVAVKVLPEHMAQNAEALARFEREAHTAAGLNDPHICSLHDVGVEDDVRYAVFELLEGETLRERLSHGALLVSKAVELATQMCQGLATAHAKGIVHRDLKPENLFLTRSGLKILDLGLAKLLPGGVSGEEDLSREPTLSAQQQLTRPGAAPGTVAYMSPEQARGEQADARSDIFTAGAVLFEMLSGQRPFRRGTQAETLVAILNEAPPELATTSGPAAPGLERIVRRCLEKDPEDRFQSARDVGFALDAVSGASEVSGVGTEAGRRSRATRRRTLVAVGGAALVALLGGILADRLWLRPSESGSGKQVIRSQIDLTEDLPILGFIDRDQIPFRLDQPPFRTDLALSPDGARLVWASRHREDRAIRLHMRRLDTGEATRVTDDGICHQPFFSPDGRWVGFVRVSDDERRFRLCRIPADGGLAVDLAELAEDPMGITWGPNGRIYLGSATGGLSSVAAEGGPPRKVTRVDRTREVGHRLPRILPGGREVLFTVMPFPWGVRAHTEVVSLGTGERRVVVEDAADARYLSTGHLVFMRQGVLMAAPFDLSRLELASPPVPVIEGVAQALNWGRGFLNSGAAQYAVSDSGLLAYGPGGIVADQPIELVVVGEDGHTEPLPGFDRPLVSPQLQFSPDGRQLVFSEQPRSGLLWLFDVQRQTFRPLSDRGMTASPRWSPDGARLAVAWSEFGPLQLWVVPASGRGDWVRLTEGETMAWSPSWNPDGSTLAFVRVDGPAADILLYRFETRDIVPLLASAATEGAPEFSPDGRWLAYQSNESGRFEVYVTSFPDREKTLTVSRRGGVLPAWSGDGSRLFYVSPPSDGVRSMMVTDVRREPELSLGITRPLFQLPDRAVVVQSGPALGTGTRSYELHPDGRRFVVGRLVPQDPSPPITRLELVHNWFEELKRLVPTE